MSIFISLLLAAYALGLLMVLTSWNTLRAMPTPAVEDEDPQHYYSILIPFRNEETHLESLCDALEQLQFPADRYEVIFIDDHSEDNSTDVLARKGMRVLSLESAIGKKAALSLGIVAAKGDVIVTTDADCIPPSNWLQSLRGYYERMQAEMVFGGVTFHDQTSFFGQLQIIEFSALIGTGAAGLTLGAPNMCNGANMSFKKAAFQEVGGYRGNEHLASGDDEFLMHKFYQQYEGKVYFNNDPTSVVQTDTHVTFRGFFHQRRRWAGKWRHYKDWKTTIMALFVFMVNLVTIASLFTLLQHGQLAIMVGIFLVTKVIIEYLFLSRVLIFLGKKLFLFHFFVLQLIYPFYVVFFGVAANFGAYSWKGRRQV